MKNIYNSRNYLGYLNLEPHFKAVVIYNSRNYLGYLNLAHIFTSFLIYNSRNYLGYLNKDMFMERTVYLQ